MFSAPVALNEIVLLTALQIFSRVVRLLAAGNVAERLLVEAARQVAARGVVARPARIRANFSKSEVLLDRHKSRRMFFEDE